MKTLTVDYLKSLNACSEQVDLFQTVFGDSALITLANCRKGIDAGLSANWLVKRLPAPAGNLYNESVAQAGNLYEESRAQALNLYKESVAQAGELYNEIRAPAWNLYNESVAQAGELYNEIRAQALYKALKSV